MSAIPAGCERNDFPARELPRYAPDTVLPLA